MLLINSYRLASTVLVSDDFSEADGTNLHGKAADTGQTWSVTTGTWDINSGKARPTTAGAQDRAVINAGTADMEVSAVISGLDTNGVGVIARSDATDQNGYVAIATASQVELYKKVGGSYTALVSGASPGFNGGTLTLSVRGTAIIVRIGSAIIINTTDSAVATGDYAGIWDFSTGHTIDNFSVRPATPLGALSNVVDTTAVSSESGGGTLVSNGGGGWKNAEVREFGQIIEDPSPSVAARTFVFTYSGRDAGGDIDVGIAFSETGADGTFTDYASNPIISLGEDPYVVKDLTTGKAYRDVNGIHVFSETKTAGDPGSQSGIQHHYSTDGVTWTADPANPVVGPAGGGAWDHSDRTSPVVVYDGSQFVMLFEGRNIGTNAGKIGVARKASISGTGWTMDAANPIVGFTDPWALASIVPDDIIKNGSQYVLIVHGNTTGTVWSVGRFSTTVAPGSWNASSFTEMTGNPLDVTSVGQAMPANVLGSKLLVYRSSGASIAFWNVRALT